MPTSKARQHRRGVPGGNPNSRSQTRGAAKSAEGPLCQLLSGMLFSSLSPFRSSQLDELERYAIKMDDKRAGRAKTDFADQYAHAAKAISAIILFHGTLSLPSADLTSWQAGTLALIVFYDVLVP